MAWGLWGATVACGAMPSAEPPVAASSVGGGLAAVQGAPGAPVGPGPASAASREAVSWEGWRGGLADGPLQPRVPEEPWWQRVGYWWASADGHMRLLRAARPVSEWLADPATPAPLRERLGLAVQMRAFSVQVLGLPDNPSYQRYADLGRSAAVWNVVAAAPLSLSPKTWCFPVVGCVGYRGYHDPAQAQAMAQTLRTSGWEVHVYPVPAYSTLGRLPWPWLADPLLNTFVTGSEAGLARLMFHELSHQVAYASDDTAFNESYATAVERLGTRQWWARRGPAGQAQAEAMRVSESRQAGFEALTRRYRDELARLYSRPMPEQAMREAKAATYRRLWDDYRVMRDGEWAGDRRYDAWFAEANNARFALLSTYTRWVPAFETLFERCGRDFPRFHAQVRRLAGVPAAEREGALTAGTCGDGRRP